MQQQQPTDVPTAEAASHLFIVDALVELEDVGIVADTAHCVCVLVDVVLVAAIVATNQRILHVYATLSMRLRIIRNFLSVPVLFVFVILCFLCHI